MTAETVGVVIYVWKRKFVGNEHICVYLRIHPFLWDNMDANLKLFPQCACISQYFRNFPLSNFRSSNRRLQSADAI